MNQTTRKHPRTLQEAFGPYTARELYAPPDPRRERLNALAGLLSLLVGLVAIGVILAWRV